MTIVDDIKERLNIIDEIGSSVKLRRTGKNYAGLCPFHAEKTGSFIVFPGTQTWRCFGACNTGGDIFDFLIKKEGWDFDQAMRYLASKAGVELRPQTPEQRQKQEAQRAREAVLGALARYFANALAAKDALPRPDGCYSDGLEYALQRGWWQETLISAQVGYFGKDWNGLRAWLKQENIEVESPAAAAFVGFRGDVAAWGRKWNVQVAPGWVEDKKIPAMPPGMLMYAHVQHGRVTYISGRRFDLARALPEDMPKSWNPPSELVGARQPYFNHFWWENEKKGKETRSLVVVEGQADAITLGQWGIAAVALAGSAVAREAGTLTSEAGERRTDNLLLSELKRRAHGESGARVRNAKIVVALDQDEPGRKARAAVIEALSGAGIGPTQIASLEWPEKDANAWLQSGTGSAERAAELVAGAETLLEELVEAAQPINGRSDDEAIQKLFAELAKLTPFEVEKVREEICERTNLRRRVFDGMLKAARRDAGKGEDGQPAYFVEGGRIFARYFDARGGETVEALCNFNAEITGDVLRDNGQDIIREFQMRGTIGKLNLPMARVKAEDFGKMEWPLSAWGSRAIIEAGSRRRDQLRAAIQHLSKHVERKTIYTHTGWREIDDGTKAKRIYLTACGAVGGEAVDVELDQDLDLYAIPTTAQDPKSAMALSLSFLDIAPDRIAYPIWGAMFLPPLRELINVAFVLWVFGGSGAMKTTYVTLGMNHYGPRFDDKHVPSNFIDSANRMEQKAFIVKDAPLLIDDFAPQKDSHSHNQYTQSAHRIVRAAGNLSGRGRLNADATAKSTYVPRGLVVITGEDIPTSESLVARLFVVEMNKGDVDLIKLSALQAQRERLSHAMSGYLRWAAEYWPGWIETVPNRWRDYRQRAFEAGYHLRLPEAVAGLMMGIEMGLRYAQVLGLINAPEYEARLNRGWAALRDVAAAMSARVKEEKPEVLFLRTLSELITQKKIYLRPADGMGTTNLGAESEREHAADMMGWYDRDRMYLLPEAIYNKVCKHYRDMGNVFPVRENTLRKALDEAGIIDTQSRSRDVDTDQGREVRTEKRRTLVVSLEGQPRRVMVILRAKLKDQEES